MIQALPSDGLLFASTVTQYRTWLRLTLKGFSFMKLVVVVLHVRSWLLCQAHSQARGPLSVCKQGAGCVHVKVK
jgi:hypothetical protein